MIKSILCFSVLSCSLLLAPPKANEPRAIDRQTHLRQVLLARAAAKGDYIKEARQQCEKENERNAELAKEVVRRRNAKIAGDNTAKQRAEELESAVQFFNMVYGTDVKGTNVKGLPPQK